MANEVKLLISGDPESFKRATREAAVEMDKLQKSGESLTQTTTKSTRASEAYVEALKREAIALGAGEQALRAYDMAQLGLSENARRKAEALHRAIDAHKAAERAALEHGAAAERLGRHLGNLINVAATAAFTMAGFITKEVIQRTIEQEQSVARLEARLKAIGYAAGLTRAEIEKMVSRLSQTTIFDDDKVRAAATALLGFKDVSRDVFEEALRRSADLATSLGTDLVSSARKVGAALQDPERAVRLLAEAGRDLDAAQQQTIRRMVEVGDYAGANRIVLEALRGTVGGMAEAMNNGMTKATVDLAKSWDDLLKTLGASESVGGVLQATFRAIADAIRDIDDLLSRGAGEKLARLFGFGLHAAGGVVSMLPSWAGGRGGEWLQDMGARVGGASYGSREGPSMTAEARIAERGAAELGRGAQQAKAMIDALTVSIADNVAIQAEAGMKLSATGKDYERVRDAAEKYIDSLEKEAATLGMTTAEKKAYEVAAKAATLATQKEREEYLKRAQPLLEDIRMYEERAAQAKKAAADSKEILRVEEMRRRELERGTAAYERELESLVRANEEYGKSRVEIEAMTLAKLEAQYASIDFAKSTYEEVAALEKRLDIQRQIVQQAGRGEQLREQARLWDDVSNRVARFGTTVVDAAMRGESAVESLINELKNLGLELLALTAKKWILQIVAGVTGNSGIAGMAAQVGQGTLTGAISSGLGNLLGGTALGQFWGGMTGSIAGPALPGSALGMGQQVAGIASAFWWIAPIIAGMIANDRAFSQGWRRDGQDTTANLTSGGVYDVDRIFRGLGLNDRMASLLSGSSLHTRLFGHRRTQADAYGMSGTISGSSVSGGMWQDYSQAGGTFRSDRRWTEQAALSPGQQDFLTRMMGGVTALVEGLGRRLGVNVAGAVAGYSRDFNLQMNENGEPLSDERIAELFNELFAGVLQDQVSRVLKVADRGQWAEYVANLKGTGEEILTAVQNVLDFIDAIDALDIAISVLEGNTSALEQSLLELDQRVNKAQEGWASALAGGDPGEMLAAQRELTAAIVDRYQKEMQAVLELQRAVDDLRQAAYETSISIAQKIVAAGGVRDIPGMSLSRALSLQGQVGGAAQPDRQLRLVGQYVGAIDNWYNARRAAIERDAAAQQQAAQAAISAQQAVFQARIAALQTELQLTQQWAGILDRVGQVIGQMQLTGINPLHAQGRYVLAGEQADAAEAAYRAATGTGRVDAAGRYVDALQAQLGLLGESYQRPSAQYQEGYNQIIRRLTEVQAEAQTQANRGVQLQEQLVALQSQANAFGQASAAYAASSSAALDALNEEYIGYMTWAEGESERLYNLQIEHQEEMLDAITGGRPVEVFMAEKQQEMVDLLKEIRDAMKEANFGGSGAPSTTPAAVAPKAAAVSTTEIINAITRAAPTVRRVLSDS